jgi:hypothetical protein
MEQPTPASKQKAVLALGAMMLVSLVVTGLVTAGMGALVSLAWNAAIARPFGAPALGFFSAWAIFVVLGLVVGGTRIALSERARRKKTL